MRSDGLGYDLGLENFRHHIEGAAMTWDGGSPELPPLWGPGMEDLLGPARRSAERAARDEAQGHRRDAAGAASRRWCSACCASCTPQTGLTSLCLAGGVALNCVVNGKIFDETPFTDLYIQPAAYDGGTSVGAALLRAPPEAEGAARLRDGPRVLGPRVLRRARCAPPSTPPGSSARSCRPTRSIARTADALAEGGGRRLVPGPDRVRPASARQPLDPDRPAPRTT